MQNTSPRRLARFMGGLLLIAPLAGCKDSGASPPQGKQADEEVSQTEAGQGQATPQDSPEPAPEALAAILTTNALRDFGRIWEGSKVSHEFEFTAGGDADLTIIDYKPDCGCTVAHLEIINEDGSRSPYEVNTAVPAGTRFALAATFDTRGREGVQSKAVVIFANVPGGRRDMTLRANIQPFLTVTPRVGAVGRISTLDSADIEFLIESVSGDRFTLEATRKGLPPQVEVVCIRQGDEAEDGKASAWKVRCLLNTGMPLGIRTYPVELTTDMVDESAERGPDGREVFFTVSPMISAAIVGPVAATPQNLNFGMLTTDQTVARTIRVESHDPSFRLAEPKTRIRAYKEGASLAFAETLHVTAREVEGEGAWDLELLLEGLDPGVGRSFLGYLVIETGHPDVPVLQVTLSGMKRGN